MTDRPMIYRDDAIARIEEMPLKSAAYPTVNVFDAVVALSALAPVHVDAAHIRAEALREAADRLPACAACGGSEAILALIATPPPPPDVGALVRDLLEGYGASYIDSETWEKVTTEAKAFLDLAAQEGGNERPTAHDMGAI